HVVFKKTSAAWGGLERCAGSSSTSGPRAQSSGVRHTGRFVSQGTRGDAVREPTDQERRESTVPRWFRAIPRECAAADQNECGCQVGFLRSVAGCPSPKH